MNKPYFTYIFVVLVYRNTTDLKEFFSSFAISHSKIIVVNSYYDDHTDCLFEQIAQANNADYITVPNKGYGAGNNRGIEFALEKYHFDWLIISNADIKITHWDDITLSNNNSCIIAPKILTRTNKNQNPSTPFQPFSIVEKLKYYTYKGNHNIIIYIFYIWSRLNKIFYYLISKCHKFVFSPHGAFIIIPYKVIKELGPFFNEDMFLFNEEEHLGKLAKSKGIDIRYSDEIIISHKEDGSVSLMDESVFSRSRQSYLKLYEYWNKKSK